MAIPRTIYVVLLLASSSVLYVACQHITCTPGTLNVILSAPHGGYDTPPEIPDRVTGCYINGACVYTHGCTPVDTDKCLVKTLRDSYTKEITGALALKLELLTGKKPHVVINNLHRKKLDANREINEATFGNPTATAAYNEFQQCIETASTAVESDASQSHTGLFIDIHGQAHSHGMQELGYLVIRSRLNNNNPLAKYSSLKYLDSRSSLTFEEILRGSHSLGKFLEDAGYATLPSPNNPQPGSLAYFTGGYNTKTHGSRYGGKVDGIQIEASSSVRNAENYAQFAEDLAQAIKSFLDAHY